MGTTKSTDVYILGMSIDQMEPYLRDRGFGSGLVLFAIPDLGIQFKCRVAGEGRSLEFAALLTLLQFLEKKLTGQKLSRLKVHSSDPAFVFAMAHALQQGKGKNKQIETIKKWLKKMTIEIAIIPEHRNLARLAPTEIPSTPAHVPPALDPGAEDNRPRFRSLQKGIDLQ